MSELEQRLQKEVDVLERVVAAIGFKTLLPPHQPLEERILSLAILVFEAELIKQGGKSRGAMYTRTVNFLGRNGIRTAGQLDLALRSGGKLPPAGSKTLEHMERVRSIAAGLTMDQVDQRYAESP